MLLTAAFIKFKIQPVIRNSDLNILYTINFQLLPISHKRKLRAKKLIGLNVTLKKSLDLEISYYKNQGTVVLFQ